MREVWVDIRGYEGLYQISNWGRVKSLNYNRTKQERILKNSIDKCGYLYIVLWKNGKKKKFLIHRLVAETFILNPNNHPCINHKNEDKELNFVYINADGSVDESKSNLEWCTHAYNSNYGTRNERMAKALVNGKTSKAVLQYSLDGTLLQEFPSTKEVERQLGFAHQNIVKCCNGCSKYSHAYGFKWLYKDDIEGWQRSYCFDIE